MNHTSRTLAAIIALFAFSSTQVFPLIPINFNPRSDASEAREDAHTIAIKFIALQYNITTIARGDNRQQYTVFELDLVKGLDCVLMVGIDDAMNDVDLYVRDDNGNDVASDTRTIRRACVKFNSSYNGSYTVMVRAAPSPVLGNFYLLGGFRPQ